MARASWVMWAGALLATGALMACGSDVNSGSPGGSGGTAGHGGSGGSGFSGGGGSGAAAGAAGMGGAGGVGGGGGAGGAIPCPDINCSYVCPGSTWPEADGCPSCACAADLEMVVDGQALAPQHLTLTTTPSLYIGGIDRWVFAFSWLYDDPQMDDEEQGVDATVRIMRIDPKFDPALPNVTYFHPADDGNPLEVLDGTWHQWGVVVLSEPLTYLTGFLSIRRQNDHFQGYVSLDGEVIGNSYPYTVHIAGPFDVLVPSG